VDGKAEIETVALQFLKRLFEEFPEKLKLVYTQEKDPGKPDIQPPTLYERIHEVAESREDTPPDVLKVVDQVLRVLNMQSE
jgi:hypothetical protein